MKILIEGTEKTPFINFDHGIIEIKGRSILEDSTPFFQPLLEWIEKYIEKPAKSTIVNFAIEYSNSNSNKFIFKMIQLFEKCFSNENDIKINWYYESDDDAIKDLGLDLKALLKIPFDLIEVSD